MFFFIFNHFTSIKDIKPLRLKEIIESKKKLRKWQRREEQKIDDLLCIQIFEDKINASEKSVLLFFFSIFTVNYVISGYCFCYLDALLDAHMQPWGC